MTDKQRPSWRDHPDADMIAGSFSRDGPLHKLQFNAGWVYDFQRVTGTTHKAEGAIEAIAHAEELGADVVSVISSGNYLHGLRTARVQRNAKVRIVNLVNDGQDSPDQLVMPQKRILRDAKEREAFVQSRLPNTKVFDCTDYIPRVYYEEAEYLAGQGFDYIALPVGSGKLFVALHRQIASQCLETKLVGILPCGENGVFNDHNLYEQDGLLYFKEFSPKSLADKLVCPYTFYKPDLLRARDEGHLLYEASELELGYANELAYREDFAASVSGSAAFVFAWPRGSALCDRLGIPQDANLLLINTGKGLQEKQLRPIRDACSPLD